MCFHAQRSICGSERERLHRRRRRRTAISTDVLIFVSVAAKKVTVYEVKKKGNFPIVSTRTAGEMEGKNTPAALVLSMGKSQSVMAERETWVDESRRHSKRLAVSLSSA